MYCCCCLLVSKVNDLYFLLLAGQQVSASSYCSLLAGQQVSSVSLANLGFKDNITDNCCPADAIIIFLTHAFTSFIYPALLGGWPAITTIIISLLASKNAVDNKWFQTVARRGGGNPSLQEKMQPIWALAMQSVLQALRCHFWCQAADQQPWDVIGLENVGVILVISCHITN